METTYLRYNSDNTHFSRKEPGQQRFAKSGFYHRQEAAGTWGSAGVRVKTPVKHILAGGYTVQNGKNTFYYKIPKKLRYKPNIGRTPVSGNIMRVVGREMPTEPDVFDRDVPGGDNPHLRKAEWYAEHLNPPPPNNAKPPTVTDTKDENMAAVESVSDMRTDIPYYPQIVNNYNNYDQSTIQHLYQNDNRTFENRITNNNDNRIDNRITNTDNRVLQYDNRVNQFDNRVNQFDNRISHNVQSNLYMVNNDNSQNNSLTSINNSTAVAINNILENQLPSSMVTTRPGYVVGPLQVNEQRLSNNNSQVFKSVIRREKRLLENPLDSSKSTQQVEFPARKLITLSRNEKVKEYRRSKRLKASAEKKNENQLAIVDPKKKKQKRG